MAKRAKHKNGENQSDSPVIQRVPTIRYVEQDPKQLGVHPVVAGLISDLKSKNDYMKAEIAKNERAISILIQAEVQRAGEDYHNGTVLNHDNTVLCIPQKPLRVFS